VNIGLPGDLSWYRIFADQSGVIGGLLALLAGIVVYIAGRTQANAARYAARTQLETERNKSERDVDALRKSLATELRQLILRALGAHDALLDLSQRRDILITAWMVESYARVPSAPIYQGSASKIGLLGLDAMDVVVVYQLLDLAHQGATQLLRFRTPDNISPQNVAVVAQAFLHACMYALQVLPKFKTGVEVHDSKDGEIFERIQSAATRYQHSSPPP
jgi:hypothetical protein